MKMTSINDSAQLPRVQSQLDFKSQNIKSCDVAGLASYEDSASEEGSKFQSVQRKEYNPEILVADEEVKAIIQSQKGENQDSQQ